MTESESTSDGHLAAARTRDRELNLALALDIGRARELARKLDRTLYRAIELDGVRTYARDLKRARDLNGALGRALVSACDRALAINRDLNLNRDLYLARDHARDLTRALARDLERARDLVRDVHAALTWAKGAADYQVEQCLAARTDVARGPAPVTGPVPVRAVSRWVARTTQLLPPADRATYREVFDAELRDLATAGATRCAQLAYAINLTVRTWSLRQALRPPAWERTK